MHEEEEEEEEEDWHSSLLLNVMVICWMVLSMTIMLLEMANIE